MKYAGADNETEDWQPSNGFVIDAGEATQIFGSDVVKSDSPEYRLANDLFFALDLIEWIVGNEFGRVFNYVGTGDGAMVFQKTKT